MIPTFRAQGDPFQAGQAPADGACLDWSPTWKESGTLDQNPKFPTFQISTVGGFYLEGWSFQVGPGNFLEGLET